MIDEVLTEEEEKILEQLKGLFYYPSDSVWASVARLIKPFQLERAAEILEVGVIQIGFEQKQRRDFVLSSLGIVPPAERIRDAELFVRMVADSNGDVSRLRSLMADSKIDEKTFPAPSTIQAETLGQAKIYGEAASALEGFYSEALYQKRVKPIMELLKKLTPEQLESVLVQTKDFIIRVQQLGSGSDVLVKDPDFSPAMKELIAKTGLSVLADQLQTIGERLSLCSNITLAAGVLSANAKQGSALSDEQAGLAAGLWLYGTQGTPLAQEILTP